MGLVAPKPTFLNYQQAASVPVAALTAYQVLHDVTALQPGQHVLIRGGAGSVGSFVVQFTKRIGAEVIATMSAKNADYVRGLGADQVIDYQTEAVEKLASNLDLFGRLKKPPQFKLKVALSCRYVPRESRQKRALNFRFPAFFIIPTP